MTALALPPAIEVSIFLRFHEDEILTQCQMNTVLFLGFGFFEGGYQKSV